MAALNPGTAFERATEAAASLRARLPLHFHKPSIAIICGSGLGGLQHTLDEERVEFPYEGIPHFPRSTGGYVFDVTCVNDRTVQGHEGKLVFGRIKHSGVEKVVLLLVGRAHFYEGHSMDLVTFATRVCKRLDVDTIIVTNAAGGLNPEYAVGDIVLLHDHLNLAGLVGVHPLRGPNEESFGTRFPPLSDAYDLSLRRAAHRAWNKLGLASAGTAVALGPDGKPERRKERRLREGVYAFVGGPTYETRAECRMLRGLGADLVGMSTVPEIVVARHAGMRVLAFSLVTNNAVLQEGLKGDDETIQALSEAELQTKLSEGKANHEEVLEAGREAAEVMQSLVKEIVTGL